MRSAQAESLGSLLILMAVPCVLPIPGIGNVMGLGMMGLAWAIWQGDVAAGLISRARTSPLNAHHRRKIRRVIRRVHRLAAPWCRPRLEGLVSPSPRSWHAASAAALVAIMGALIFLPIPLGNVLPAASVTCLGLGLSHRDGVAALWSAGLAVLALAYTAALAAGAWAWIMAPLARWAGFTP
jgi:hypothetical protein